VTQETHPIADFTDAALDAMLKRALRNTLILGAVPALVVWIASGWRNAAMLLTGAAVSAASIWEWQRLARLINARLDNQRTPVSSRVVVLFFVLRLTVFAGVIYGSLKCFQGSAVALLCGLGLAVFTLGWEAVRLLRS
jgi:hypothetical protein